MFPGSTHKWTKNWKEREEPGKIYHMRNIIDRKNSITCGQTNELAHTVKTFIRLQKFFGRQHGTRRHYATLSVSMESCGEHTQTRTFVHNTYLANWPLHTPENGFQSAPRWPFPRLCSSFLEKTARTGSYENTATCTVDYQYANTCVGTPTIRLRSIKSSLPFSLPLHHSGAKII